MSKEDLKVGDYVKIEYFDKLGPIKSDWAIMKVESVEDTYCELRYIFISRP